MTGLRRDGLPELDETTIEVADQNAACAIRESDGLAARCFDCGFGVRRAGKRGLNIGDDKDDGRGPGILNSQRDRLVRYLLNLHHFHGDARAGNSRGLMTLLRPRDIEKI